MRKALVVGLNNYPNSPLNGCIEDAIKMKTVLEKHADGSPNFGIKLVTDENGDITKKATIRADIEKLFEDPSDVALFYFSGHGLIKSTGGYIVTTDYERYDEGISMNDILILANKSEAKDKIVILDCCHSGAFGNPDIDEGSAQLSEGLTILAASRSTESAMEINGSGVFTSLLIDGLQGGAADLRGFTTPGNLYAYVDQALGPWDQRPIFKTNVSKFTSIRNLNPPVSLTTLRKLTDYFESPENEFQLDPTYEFDNDEIAIQSHVEIFKNLQKFVSVGLVVPVGEDHMYYAAMNSKSCKLTALGYQYWRLVNEDRI